MKLKHLKAAIDLAVESAGGTDPDIEVWVGKRMHRIVGIGQFTIAPDMTITLGPVILDLDVEEEKIRLKAESVHLSAVKAAREARVCRICGEKMEVRNKGETYNFGQEYAHTQCLGDHDR